MVMGNNKSATKKMQANHLAFLIAIRMWRYDAGHIAQYQ